MRKIKKGDAVIVIAGKDKGRTGQVLSVLKPKTRRDKRFSDLRVRVQGINLIKKHVKSNPQQGIEGGIVEREAALQISNVALVNPSTGKADRVGFRITEDGKKVRFFKSNNELVDK